MFSSARKASSIEPLRGGPVVSSCARFTFATP